MPNEYGDFTQSEIYKILKLGLVAVFGLIILISLIGPIYGVWEQEQVGKAELARAEFGKQVAVQEALAHRDSAKLLAEAEVERAKGVAQANEIIGNSLKDNEEYLRYLYINSISEKDHQIIYIPTEAGLPILEATRNIQE